MVTGITAAGNAAMTANVMGATSMPVAAAVLKDGPPTTKSDRRSNKPIMEKRRRARINNCLNELKMLILDATKKDPARHSKLEKADILEKTVKHLQELQRQQAAMQQAADPKIINKFKAGFTDCANEVSRFPGLEPAVKRRLLQHLGSCINNVKAELHHHHHHQQQQQQLHQQHLQQQRQMMPSPPSSPEHQETQQQQHQQQAATAAAVAAASHFMQLQQTINGYFLPNGIQVIPTKLPNGSIALILPQSLTHPATVGGTGSMLPPTRTASTGSASSQSSSSSSSLQYAPPSPANSYEAMDCKPSPTVIQHASSATATASYEQQLLAQQQQALEQLSQQQQQQQQAAMLQQPLSLVIKKNDIKQEDEQPCWRPW